MATAIAPWRLSLQPASYNGAGFFVEVDTKASGRRIALHEYPKRDQPYAEDMGRRAKRFTVTGYVIGPNYEQARDALIQQLEMLGNGVLTRPTTVGDEIVVCDTYSVSERRERGGTAQFEMAFIEAGTNIADQSSQDTQGQTNTAVDNAASPSVFDNGTSPVSFMNSSDIPAGGFV